MSDPTASLDRLVAKAGRLYSLPAVAMKVLELTDNPRVDVHALKECIENDPALTTKLLRVVNSSLFGLSGEVSDLNQALALLGIKPLKLLVLGFSLPERLFHGVASEILERYWRHTLTKAVAAREISETLWDQPGDEAFIAGLLQDLGLLVLIQQLGEPYIRFLNKVDANGGNLAALQREALGFDHTMLTSRLLDHWGLPNVLVEAVCRTASQTSGPSATSPSPLPQIVQLAGLIAELLADGRPDALSQLRTDGQQSPALSAEQLEELVGSLEEKVRQLAGVLSLRLPEGRAYRDVLAEAHERLADVAAEAAEDLVFYQSRPQDSPSAGGQLADELHALSLAVGQVSPSAPDFAAAPAPAQAASGHVAVELAEAPSAAPSDWAREASTQGSPSGRSIADDVDPGLLGQLGVSINACRKSHCPLTLLLAEMDDVEDLAVTYGVEGFHKLRSFVEHACRGVDHADAICLPHRDVGFAIILPDCERQPAVRMGNQLIERVERLTPGRSSGGRPSLNISVGAATVSVPTKNFPPEDLVHGAERCLFASHTSGGGVVKSIEIY